MSSSKHDSFVLNDYQGESKGNPVVVNPKCHGTVKIYVTTEKDEEKIKENKVQQPDPEVKKKKSLCFCFTKPKKSPTKENEKSNEQKETEVLFESSPQVMKKMDMDLSEMGLEEIVQNARSERSGFVNTNTIIFPKDSRCGGDGMLCLQNWLRMETQCNSRILEEVLGEIHKIRREMQNMKEMLEVVSGMIKEQQSWRPVLVKKTQDIDLERKSNSLSFKKSSEKQVEAKVSKKKTKDVESQPSKTKSPEEEEKKKKLCSWLWCK